MKTAWIIDDDPIYVYGFKRMLNSVGFAETIVHHEHGARGLEALVESLNHMETFPDYIFLDINMPIMDGWQFLDHLNPEILGKRVHVILNSSSIDPNDLKKAETYELVRKYLTKPSSLQELKALQSEIAA